MAAASSSPDACRFDAATTCAEAQAAMKRAFIAAGIDTPDLDARLLLCGLLDLDAAKLITAPLHPLGDGAAAVSAAAGRRIAHEPVSRILGRRDFYGRRFEVTPATLDPRPDTETVVDAVLGYVDNNGGRQRPWRLLDVGTGTGCLLITLLAELPFATGVGSDISAAALAVAERNAKLLHVEDRADWRLADGLDGLTGRFDIIVSNPPYIPSAQISALAPEVRAYDPHLALDGGADGLDFYRRFAGEIVDLISEGYIVFEIGYDQAEAVSDLLAGRGRDLGWPVPTVISDLAGNARSVAQTARR